MTGLATMQLVVSIVATICGVVSFCVYLAITLNWVRPAAHKTVEESIQQALSSTKGVVGASAKDIAELLKALASLTDSLVKAGPALWSLIGSALYLLIACLAAGVIWGSSDGNSTARPSNEINAVDNQDLPQDENLNVGRAN